MILSGLKYILSYLNKQYFNSTKQYISTAPPPSTAIENINAENDIQSQLNKKENKSELITNRTNINNLPNRLISDNNDDTNAIYIYVIMIFSFMLSFYLYYNTLNGDYILGM